jgi:chemotaxis protein methyltransferase CheR
MEPIITFLEQKTGFLLDDDRRKNLTALVKKRMHLISEGSSERYLMHIRSMNGSDELINLISRLTIGETYFLRNHDHWRALKEFVLPGIVDSKRRIKIWSAGCSTGEESYTIAISLLEELVFLQTWDVKIIATDINQASLETAKEGLYTRNSFRGVEGQWIEKYFSKEKERYRIKERIRKMVEYSRLNLISPNGFPLKFMELDIIFCRNVLMYFRPEVYRDVLRHFAECLKEGGFLFLGHAEGSMAPNTIFKPINCCNTFIYQKRTIRGRGFGFKKIDNRKKSNQEQESISQKSTTSIQNKKSNQSAINDPNCNDHYDKALKHYFREDFCAALNTLSKKESENQNDLKVLILKALIYIGMLDLDHAKKCQKHAYLVSDISPEVHMVAAMIKEAKKDYDGAIKTNLVTIFLDRDFFSPVFRLGYIYQSLGEPKKAVKQFANATEVLKRDEEKRVQLFCGGASKKLLEDICRKRCRL